MGQYNTAKQGRPVGRLAGDPVNWGMELVRMTTPKYGGSNTWGFPAPAAAESLSPTSLPSPYSGTNRIRIKPSKAMTGENRQSVTDEPVEFEK